MVGVGVGGGPPYQMHLYYYNGEGIYYKLREKYMKSGTCVSNLHVVNEILIKKKELRADICRKLAGASKIVIWQVYEKLSINLRVK